METRSLQPWRQPLFQARRTLDAAVRRAPLDALVPLGEGVDALNNLHEFLGWFSCQPVAECDCERDIATFMSPLKDLALNSGPPHAFISVLPLSNQGLDR